jgi:hypothetical protein
LSFAQPVAEVQESRGIDPNQGDAVPAETHVEKGPWTVKRFSKAHSAELLADILEIRPFPPAISGVVLVRRTLDADSLALIKELVEGPGRGGSAASVPWVSGSRDEDLEGLRTGSDAVDYTCDVKLEGPKGARWRRVTTDENWPTV